MMRAKQVFEVRRYKRFFDVQVWNRYTQKEIDEGYTSRGRWKSPIPMKEVKRTDRQGRTYWNIVPKTMYKLGRRFHFKRRAE